MSFLLCTICCTRLFLSKVLAVKQTSVTDLFNYWHNTDRLKQEPFRSNKLSAGVTRCTTRRIWIILTAKTIPSYYFYKDWAVQEVDLSLCYFSKGFLVLTESRKPHKHFMKCVSTSVKLWAASVCSNSNLLCTYLLFNIIF